MPVILTFIKIKIMYENIIMNARHIGESRLLYICHWQCLERNGEYNTSQVHRKLSRRHICYTVVIM